jgi:hypothetical protein
VTLADLQAAFACYLVGGDNEAELAAEVVSDGVNAAARLEVYRSAFYMRLQDALAHDFPALLAAAGEASFGRLTAGYLRDRPSARPSLRWLGEGLAEWLRARGELALADLAELEWAALRAFDAEDAAPLTAEAFAAIPPERWPELRLELHPSVSLLAVGANVREVWLAVRAGRPPSTLRSARERLVIWRANGRSQVEAIPEGWHRLLASLARDATLAAACEELAESIDKGRVPDLVAECLHRAAALDWLKAATSWSSTSVRSGGC